MSEDEYSEAKPKFNNSLPFWGNETSMNLNSLILTNIQSSTYFKVSLFKLKTYHEVIDEIYYQVKHMEPWEKGSRKTSGQTGMCGGVRGVGAGGIVSSAFCLLYKLYTLRLTRKQLNGLLTHCDSPYIRALGFMYIRYTQPPADLYNWYEEYLSDEEEIDIKAGGGQVITIGQMLVQFLTKLDWCGTLFPRIPVPIQKQIQSKLEEYAREYGTTIADMTGVEAGSSKPNGPRSRQNDYEDRGKGYNNYENKKYRNDDDRNGGDAPRRRDWEDKGRHYSSSSQHHGSSKHYRDRSRSPNRDKDRDRHRYNDSDRGAGSSGSGRHRRRSPSEDRYDSYSRHTGSRDDFYEKNRSGSRDDYYDKGSYKSSYRRY